MATEAGNLHMLFHSFTSPFPLLPSVISQTSGQLKFQGFVGPKRCVNQKNRSTRIQKKNWSLQYTSFLQFSSPEVLRSKYR